MRDMSTILAEKSREKQCRAEAVCGLFRAQTNIGNG